MKKVLNILLVALIICPHFSFAASAKAMIEGTSENSELIGIVRLQDTDEGLRAEINIFGAPPGLHGIHIHENGSCAEAGNAAGGHYNPDKVKHGFVPTDGFTQAHPGDFGNIEITESGEGTLLLVIPDLTISGGKINIEGKSIILHEKQDDFGQPTGNAGARIGCGVIQLDEKEENPAV